MTDLRAKMLTIVNMIAYGLVTAEKRTNSASIEMMEHTSVSVNQASN